MLFLANFVVWLEDEPPPAGLTGWELVELLGRHLLEPQEEDFADDPIWALLSGLDGRPVESVPGLAPRQDLPVRVPVSWARRWQSPPHLFQAGDVVVGQEEDHETSSPARLFDEVVGGFVRQLLSSRQIPLTALARPGWVQVTATHVDVALSLEGTDMAARAAGLDQDPGWVPALGHIVLFHFIDGAAPWS
jgi:hypothetical protein